MKILLLTLTLLPSPLAQAASSVNVIIDGESYSCSKGGNGGGNQCECVFELYNGSWYWSAYKRGEKETNGKSGFSSRDEAENDCLRWTKSNSACYQ